jgi:outer membrane protein TolC
VGYAERLCRVNPAPEVRAAASLAPACSPQVEEAMATSREADATLQVARSEWLPDVNILGSYFNQTSVPIIQPHLGAFGISATYTSFD